MNKAGGFITIHRQILDWEWYGDTNTFCLFIHLLLMANYSDGRFKGRLIKRGQLVTSLNALSTSVGLSIQQTRTALEHLISTGEITNKSTSEYRIITIVKYDEYQKATNEATNDQQTINKRSNKQATNEVTSKQQQYNNNNKLNKEKNKQSTPPNPLKGESESFDKFWSSYPKKRSKPQAKAAWKKIHPDDGLVDEILSGLERWKASDDWRKDNGQFIPYPATWLNNRGWEDEVQPTSSSQKKRVSAQDYDQRELFEDDEQIRRKLYEQIWGKKRG